MLFSEIGSGTTSSCVCIQPFTHLPKRANAADDGHGRRVGPLQAGIVWMRSDLRVSDHEALSVAAMECSSLVPLYCFDPAEYGKVSAIEFGKVFVVWCCFNPTWHGQRARHGAASTQYEVGKVRASLKYHP
eukprot:569062-Pelagomonas_calceolata.AAC.5